MHLGAKARIVMAAGLLLAVLFLVLGVRELRRSPAPPLSASTPAHPAPAALILAAAARPIRTGETITASMIRNALADPLRQPGAATPAELIGKVATRAIAEGALIQRDAVGGEAKLAIRVPMGMRAVSIDTTAEIAVAGLVRPGDRVDVQVVYPGADAISGARGTGRSRAQTLLQTVQVLAVGEAVVGAQQQNGEPGSAARTVTLALTPDQVSTLSLAKNTGALTLSLRNPADGEQLALAAVTSRAPDTAPAPISLTPSRPPARAVAPKPQAKPALPHSIELVVGDRRETLISGSASR